MREETGGGGGGGGESIKNHHDVMPLLRLLQPSPNSFTRTHFLYFSFILLQYFFVSSLVEKNKKLHTIQNIIIQAFIDCV